MQHSALNPLSIIVKSLRGGGACFSFNSAHAVLSAKLKIQLSLHYNCLRVCETYT